MGLECDLVLLLEETLVRVTCWRRPCLEFLKVLLSLVVWKTLDLD